RSHPCMACTAGSLRYAEIVSASPATDRRKSNRSVRRDLKASSARIEQQGYRPRGWLRAAVRISFGGPSAGRGREADARGEPVHDRVPSPAHRGRGPVGGIRVPVRRVHRPSAAEVGPSAGPILHAAVKKRKVPEGRIEHLGGEIEKQGKIDLVLLLLAVACMATARYR